MEGRAEAREEIEKAGNNKQLTRSRSSRTPGRRRWSLSTDLDTETAATPTGGGTVTMLSRSYSTTSAVADAGGGVGQQARGGGEGEIRRRSGAGAGARLSRKLKEQRARFYIVRRCVSMLVCWHDDIDDDADY